MIKPNNKEELKTIISNRIKVYGTECDLNDIDVSLITDMSWLFVNLVFDGNISQWNVSNVTDMSNMFHMSKFNKYISKWNVSKVMDNKEMFTHCPIEKNINMQPKFSKQLYYNNLSF